MKLNIKEDYTGNVQKEDSKKKLEEATFMVNNVASAQNAISNSIAFILKKRNYSMISLAMITEAVTKGIDEIANEVIPREIPIPKKKAFFRKLVMNLKNYMSSL